MNNPILPMINRALFCASILFTGVHVSAQCNVNDKYDKIISGYHSSIAMKNNGTYAVWGSAMSSTGAADVLAPQDINVANYPALTGTVLKAAIGGKNGNLQVDQAVLLTSTGLWAWGIRGNVINSSLTTSAAFQRISSPSGANTYGLPTGVNPADVASMFATYQTLCILTSSGNVWILTQTTQALEANGATATTAGNSVWKQVKTGASTFLTNVVSVRGQVSNTSYNAFMALTSSGQVYTWGNSTFLGNSTTAAARNYATQMTLPAEFASTPPKMIGVTGGIGDVSTTENTYYLLGNTGNLYCMGDNSQMQCGDFTTTDRTAWVNAKISAGANFTNINFISVQEHTSAYPAVVIITTAGDLYTWGNNSSSMIGRTDNGTSTGTISTSYNPGKPVLFSSATDNAISAELGGHTLVYLKEGASQFCYVGHRTNGSIGDGTANSSTNGSYYATCAATPSVNICGSVPVAASTTNSTISTSAAALPANGTSVATITIRLKDASGTNLTTTGGNVTVSTTAGTVGTVTDNNDGTYTVTLTSTSTNNTATLSYSINGTAASSTVQATFSTLLPLTWLDVEAHRQNKAVLVTWVTTAENNVKDFQAERSLNGVSWTAVGTRIPAAKTPGDHKYNQVDTVFNAQAMLYRIRQEDLDGRYSYSPVMTIPAIAGSNTISVYPVPVVSSFHLNAAAPAAIKNIQLFTLDGRVMKTWSQWQSSYSISELPAGNYLLRVESKNGVQTLKLQK